MYHTQRFFGYFVCLINTVLLFSACQNNPQEVTTLINSFGNLNASVAPDKSPQVINAPQDTLINQDKKQFACTTTEYSLTSVPEKFVALNPNADVLWPGEIVQGRSIAAGILDPVPVKRAPGTVTLTLVTGGENRFSEKVVEPNLSSMTQAQNMILSKFEDNTPAKFSYRFTKVYSMEQLAVSLDANVSSVNWALSSTFDFNKSDIKNRILVEFTQEYYTMAYQPPQGAKDIFHETVTTDELAPYMSIDNPPMYVASVTYGRIFYYLFETTSSMTELEAAVAGTYQGGVSVDGEVNTRHQKVINNCTIRSYGLGGNAQSAIEAATGDQYARLKKVMQFLQEGAHFSPQNPGVPISYTLRNVNDASQVKLALTTSYTARDCAVLPAKVPTKTCPSLEFAYYEKNESFVKFTCPKGKEGQYKTWEDGIWTRYEFPVCRRIRWRNFKFQCSNGKWVKKSGSTKWDAMCHGTKNANQRGIKVGIN